MISESNIRDLVARLPECYQPIFNFPHLDEAVSRQCDDRLVAIRSALETLVQHYGRPLRVLDLGCAQGFFSLSVADLCESVLGIDFLAANIDVCNAARDAADLPHVRFEKGEVGEVINKLQARQFDVVLGLSVFHHLCHTQGWPSVAALLKRLASTVDVLLLELADAREPLYWAQSLPADAVELVRDIGFIYPLGVFPTHLGDVERSLYFCSDRLWCLGSNVQRFDLWMEQSHEFAGSIHQGTRRYFFSQDLVAKTIRFAGVLANHNRREFANEENFFVKLAPRLAGSMSTLEMKSIGSTRDFGHVVTSRLPGRTLAELLVKGADFDEALILRQVLGQLVQLEAQSLYHRDVRVWNVLVDNACNARLLDPAAISELPGDDVWPYDVYASFLIFVGEVTSKAVPRVHLFRRPTLSSAWLKEPYRSWFDAIWAQSHRQWSFAGLQALLESALNGPAATGITQIHADNWALWRAVSERLLSDASDAFQLHRDAIAARATREELQSAERDSPASVTKADGELAGLWRKLANAEPRPVAFVQREQELVQIRETLERTLAELASQRSEIASLRQSSSWRVTAPLRTVGELLRRAIGILR
jgi:O-antigen chain-terminating methyltransferase